MVKLTKTEMKKLNNVISNLKESIKNASIDEDFKRISDEVKGKIRDDDYPFPAGHKSYIERCRAWNILSHQIIGAEELVKYSLTSSSTLIEQSAHNGKVRGLSPRWSTTEP